MPRDLIASSAVLMSLTEAVHIEFEPVQGQRLAVGIEPVIELRIGRHLVDAGHLLEVDAFRGLALDDDAFGAYPREIGRDILLDRGEVEILDRDPLDVN